MLLLQYYLRAFEKCEGFMLDSRASLLSWIEIRWWSAISAWNNTHKNTFQFFSLAVYLLSWLRQRCKWCSIILFPFLIEDLSWSDTFLTNRGCLFFVWQSFTVVMMMMSLWATEMRLMMQGKGCKHDEDRRSLASRLAGPLISSDGPCYRRGVAPVLNPVGSPAGTFVAGTLDLKWLKLQVD